MAIINDTTIRQCTLCGNEKSLSEYYFRNGKPNARCKDCVKSAEHARYQSKRDEICAQKKQYRADNAEAISAQRKQYREINRERISAEKSAYYAKNRERILEYVAGWREENRDRTRFLAARWNSENPERKRENQRKWRSIPENREKIAAASSQWAKTPAGRAARAESARRRRARTRELSIVEFTVDQLAQRVEYYGGKCWMCGAEFEHIDHVKPLSKGGAHVLSNLRPACSPCNLAKFNKWPFPLTKGGVTM